MFNLKITKYYLFNNNYQQKHPLNNGKVKEGGVAVHPPKLVTVEVVRSQQRRWNENCRSFLPTHYVYREYFVVNFCCMKIFFATINMKDQSI